MVYKSTNLIKQEFEKQGLTCPVREDDNTSTLVLLFPISDGPAKEVHFVSSDDSNCVLVYLFRYISNTSKEKRNGLLELINEFNNEYRFIRFILDSDGDINIEADISGRADDSCVGAEAFDIFYQIYKAANECYPKFMKYLWA